MKWFLLMMFLPSICLAKEYHFVFNLTPKGKMEYKVKAKSFDEALNIAAPFCFNFFAKDELNEERAIEVIDVCANPVQR